MSVIETLTIGGLGRSAWSSARAQPWLATWWPLVALTAIAAVLRFYAMDIAAWVPDSYERLFEASALARGEPPGSTIYPPGVSATMAPIFAILPDSLWTMQAVIAGSGVLLVPVACGWVLSLSRDRRAALMAAAVAAATPALVFSSRDGLYDTPNLLLIVVAIYLADRLRSMPLWGLVIYGILVAVMLNMRPNNLCTLPAIGLIYLSGHRVANPGDIVKALLGRPVLVSAAVCGVLCVASVALGNWTGASAGVPMTLEPAFENFAYYAYVLSYRAIGLIFVLPIAAIGVHLLWRSRPYHAAAVLYLIGVWPLLYAPFDFTSSRYMLPSLFLVLCLACIGASGLIKGVFRFQGTEFLSRFATVAVAVVGLTFVAGSAGVVGSWPETVAESDEGLAVEFRPALRDADDGSLIVSAVTRALRQDASGFVYFDLIDATLERGLRNPDVEGMLVAIDAHLASGRDVYYLYSHWEQGSDFTGTGEERYDLYWEAVTQHYRVETILEGTRHRLTGETWMLYKLTPQGGAGGFAREP